MNDGNLRTLSPSEAREQGRRGGIASGESRRERKALRECLEVALSMPYYDLDGTEYTKAQYMCIKLVDQAIEGDPRAFTIIRDTIGETVTSRFEINAPSPEAIAEVERLLMGANEDEE